MCRIRIPSPFGHSTRSSLPLLTYPHRSYNPTPLSVAPISSFSNPPTSPAFPSRARTSQYRIIIVPRPRRAHSGDVKMARMLARSTAGLRLAGMRSGVGAESPPYSVWRKDQPPQAQIVEGEVVGWIMKYVLVYVSTICSCLVLSCLERRGLTDRVSGPSLGRKDIRLTRRARLGYSSLFREHAVSLRSFAARRGYRLVWRCGKRIGGLLLGLWRQLLGRSF